MPKRSRSSKPKISDAEEKEYYRGLVRKRDKRIKLLEREVSRLTKYLMQADFDHYCEEDEPIIKAPKKTSNWSCPKCNHSECDELIIGRGMSMRKYVTCKGCSNRTRVIINDESMDT